jgi:hypothetical protein
MSDPRDEISKIIESAESAAYARGWKDGVEAVTAAALRMRAPLRSDDSSVTPVKPGVEIVITPRPSGRPPSKAIQVVEDCIAAAPGMKGVQVVKAAQLVDSSINERTVRTCLRRLRLHKTIWQRNNLWYPKKRSEQSNGEANSSPPHH